MSFPRTLLDFWWEICWDAAPEPTQEGLALKQTSPQKGFVLTSAAGHVEGSPRWVLSGQSLKHPRCLASIFFRLIEDWVGVNTSIKHHFSTEKIFYCSVVASRLTTVFIKELSCFVAYRMREDKSGLQKGTR